MIKEKTVFVIGAGASAEADFPTSVKLMSEISGLLNIQKNPYNHHLETGDRKILTALSVHVGQSDDSKSDIDSYLQAARQISGALPHLAKSIDSYIDQQRDNDKIELCGKLAIIRSILHAERNSKLWFEREIVDSHMYFEAPVGTWYTEFFKLLTDNCDKSDLKERFASITLIIFNYDRCVEHFLYCALQLSYRLTEIEAAELVKNINIYHPYGSVGALPWIDPEGAVEFGAEPSTEQLLHLVKQVKTFAEGTDPHSSEILKIREHMKVANRLVFLGFAFHEPNMQLITQGNRPGKFPNIDCFATTLDVSESDRNVIMQQINALYHMSGHGPVKAKINMADLKCSKFFLEFRKSLAF